MINDKNNLIEVTIYLLATSDAQIFETSLIILCSLIEENEENEDFMNKLHSQFI